MFYIITIILKCILYYYQLDSASVTVKIMNRGRSMVILKN